MSNGALYSPKVQDRPKHQICNITQYCHRDCAILATPVLCLASAPGEGCAVPQVQMRVVTNHYPFISSLKDELCKILTLTVLHF